MRKYYYRSKSTESASLVVLSEYAHGQVLYGGEKKEYLRKALDLNWNHPGSCLVYMVIILVWKGFTD